MSQDPTINQETRCRYCDKKLYGRAGKIFCNVDCKNNFNSRLRSKQRAAENELFPKVISAIKKNYRILLEYKLQHETTIGTLMVHQTNLKNLGFDPRYCTSARLDSDQKLWKCCFNQCWHEHGDYFDLKYEPNI